MADKLKTHYIPEIRAFLNGRKKAELLSVNLTDKCNQKCIYCEIGNCVPSTEEERLNLTDLMWIIEQMKCLNIHKLSLNGGEPFLFQGIFDVIEEAGKNDIRCWITSNGMNLYQFSSDQLQILKKYQAVINISIDSFDEQTNAKLRGTTGALSKALKSIELLRSIGVPVTVLTAISKYNYDQLFSFTKEAYRRGIKEVLFQPIIYFSNFADRQGLVHKAALNVSSDNLDKLMNELHKIRKFERNHQVRTNAYRILPWIGSYIKSVTESKEDFFFKDVVRKFYCRDLSTIIEVSYGGKVQACGLVSSKMSLKQRKGVNLPALWNKANASLKEDMNNHHYHEACDSCCHHFSRNLIASVMKYPVQNRKALQNIIVLMLERLFFTIYKKHLVK